jgi:hypothetical protein
MATAKAEAGVAARGGGIGARGGVWDPSAPSAPGAPRSPWGKKKGGSGGNGGQNCCPPLIRPLRRAVATPPTTRDTLSSPVHHPALGVP